MDIRQFSPQTQRTLAKRDFNQDQKLSVRELELFKNMPEVAGIAPKDLALIQDALKKAKGPDTIIVSLVEEDSLPGLKRPEPIYTIPAEGARKPEGRAPGQAPPKDQTPGKAKPKGPEPGFKLTATQKEAKPGKPDSTEQTDLQATGRLGDLQLKGNSSFNDGQHKSSKLNASFEPAPDLGWSLGVETAASDSAGAKSPAKSPKKDTGSKKAAPAPTASTPVQNVSLNGQINAGPLKLSAKGKLDQDSSKVKDVTGAAELKVIQGHALKTEIKQGDKKLSFSKVGSSHELAQGVALTTSSQLDEAGKVKKYGGGLSYSAAKDSSLSGLSMNAEALAKNDTTYTRPLQGWEKPELKFEFRFTRPLS
ncbi:MAG TPA: hypothetical protein V6D23_23910 [Candidatus Obscuribacterales bacterium]